MRQGRGSERARILAVVYEEGVRHFDVAPTYGMGLAERELGKFIRGKRDHVTLATKFGISPSRLARTLSPIQSFLRRTLKAVPVARQMARARGSAAISPRRFDAEMAEQSLHRSLRELRTDYVDMFLLHEPRPNDLIDPALQEALREQVEKGKIRKFGIAGSFEHSGHLIAYHPEFRDVIQIDNDLIGSQLQRLGVSEVPLIITYGAIERPLARLRNYLERRPEVAREWSLSLGVEILDPEVLPRLLFGYAIETNSDGIVLFSTTQVAHVRQVVTWFNDHAAYAPKLARLVELVRKEPPVLRAVISE